MSNVIAIDGPSGAGKSSVSKRVGRKLGYLHVDSGALYRIMTWQCLENGIDTSNPDAVAAFAATVEIACRPEDGAIAYYVKGEAPGNRIRTPKINAHASAVATVKAVRDRITAILRGLTAHGDLVVEGRDITTAVFPDSPARFFLTASAEARARRRQREEVAKGIANQSEAAVKASLLARDAIDSTRKYAPLRKADGVLEIDSSDLTLDEVVSAVLAALPEGWKNGIQEKAKMKFRKPPRMCSLVLSLSLLALSLTAAAGTRTVQMLPGESWWGLCNDFGRELPFTEKSAFSCDLRENNYAHQAQSLLVSDKGRAVWCDEPVKVAIKDGAIALASDRGEIELVEKAGANLREALEYAARNWYRPTGEEPELLYFAAPQYNTWIELTYHQNEKDILAYAQSMLDHGFPPGVFMIDDTWQAGYGDWRFEPTRFADPKGMVEKLHKMGFKVLLWMCPFVSMDTPAFRRIAWGRNPDDVKGYPAKGGFLSESPKKSWYGVPYPAPIKWWNGCSALLDFTHPNAVAWFDEQLDGLKRNFGVDGFKFDGGSVSYYAGTKDTSGEGGSAPKTYAHDRTASAAKQSALYGAFALKHRGSEYRNGFGFAGKPVIMRLHDKPHTWEALRRLVPDMLAAGFVGCPFICPDMVGGGEWSTFIPGAPFSEELFVRSAQVQALCPMMQFSASPWRYLSAANQKIVQDAVTLRQRFAPTFVELAKRAAKDGQPIMRNLEYAYPGCGYAAVRDQFLMGDDLLVAPVVEAGAMSRKIVIPPGTWKADDGAVVTGPTTVEVATPLARLPHFVRQ